MKIAIIDFSCNSVDIITVSSEVLSKYGNIEEYLIEHCQYNLNNIQWMVSDDCDNDFNLNMTHSSPGCANCEAETSKGNVEEHKKEFFKITSVSREDLEAVGFYTEDIDDFTMERLASKMGDDYCEQLFWTSMEIIADEYFQFPRIWDKWYQGADFATMEKITGLKQSDFGSEDVYPNFADACDNWWGNRRGYEKKEIYETHNQD